MISTTLFLSVIWGSRPVSLPPGNLIQNPSFEAAAPESQTPDGYSLQGDANWSWAGYKDETPTRGIRFDSAGPARKGSVTQMVNGMDYTKGHWVRFQVRGRAQDGFSVANDKLYMKIDFYAKQGASYIDTAERLIYREVLKDRKDFTVNGDNGKAGADVWRSYTFEELLPFPEVDAVKLTLAFEGGNSASKTASHFFATDFSLIQETASSEGKVEPSQPTQFTTAPSAKDLIPLGGRWYYKTEPGEEVTLGSDGRLTKPLIITDRNARQLYYKDDRLVNPFLGNMTAWLRKGFLDIQGQVVDKDRFVEDNVTVMFDGSDYWTVHARNIPNHQTATFPDTYGTQGYNPNHIQEHNYTYRFPLTPKLNPSPVAVTAHNEKRALNMGTIGIAINGVAFYNPFDAGMQDASNIMDRCCGHPSPDNRYHYHKYPICVNTPFVDKGERHSPVIGFALDGLPVYGPYEDKDEMARDSTKNPLNALNAHYDPARGWHYHVTPGKFPYLIGGYLANVVRSNLDRRPGLQGN